MLGLRLTFINPEHRQLLTSGAIDWVFGAAGDNGLPLMNFAPGLDAILHQIATRFPQTRLPLDHLNVDVTARDSLLDATIDAISSMADLPNVAVKFSALPCDVREDCPHPSLYPRIQRAVRRFGARHCFWGADLSLLPGTYGQWLDAFVQATSIFGWDNQKLTLSQALADWLYWSAA